MNSKEKIIAFMWAKEKIISDHIGESGRYFKKEDEELIREWDQETCDRVWSEVSFWVFAQNKEGLNTGTCPFCHVLFPLRWYNSITCGKCAYKDHHGGYDMITQSCSVDWNYITDGGRVPNCHTLFPNEVYRKIIEDIS